MSHCGEGLPSWVWAGLSGLRLLQSQELHVGDDSQVWVSPRDPSGGVCSLEGRAAETIAVGRGRARARRLDPGRLVCKTALPLAAESLGFRFCDLGITFARTQDVAVELRGRRHLESVVTLWVRSLPELPLSWLVTPYTLFNVFFSF